MNHRKPRTARACFLVLAGAMASVAHAAAPAACSNLTQFKVPGFAMEITKAEHIPAGKVPAAPNAPPSDAMLPAYCRADGVIDKRVGRDGKPYAIGFAIALPENWNGRFMFQGGGGLNGSVLPPLGARTNSDTPALASGFAVVSTDSGHQSAAVFDASFFRDQQATLNFLYQAIGKVTVVAKAIVAEHYGSAPKRSYYIGCSTGGREAMLMSQRYPDYFDGIVAGAPAMRTNRSNLGDRWVATALNSIAPKDESGRPMGAQAFTEAERKLIVGSFVKACDAKDGVEDGMVFNPLACDFDPHALTCKGAKTDACLSSQQADALSKGFAGPKDSKGNQVYPGFFYDTGIAASGRGIPGLLMAGSSPVGPPNFDTEMNVDEAVAVADDAVAAVGNSYQWTQLDTFSGLGGKLIFYHGISDPWFSAKDTIQYFERMVADNGGTEAVDQWSRLFLVPGMGHCAGGDAALDRFDMTTAIVDWVEKDIAPDAVVATGRAYPGRSRPLCPHPQHAHYVGKGDREKAENFECRR